MRCTNKNVQIFLYMGKFNTYTQREVLNPDTKELAENKDIRITFSIE